MQKSSVSKSRRALVQLLNAKQSDKRNQLSTESIANKVNEVQQTLAGGSAAAEDLKWIHSQQIQGAEALVNAEIDKLEMASLLLNLCLSNSPAANEAFRVWYEYMASTKKLQSQAYVSGLCEVLQNACQPSCVFLAAYYINKTYHPRNMAFNEAQLLLLVETLLNAIRNNRRYLPAMVSIQIGLALAVLCLRPPVRRRFIDSSGVESITKEHLRCVYLTDDADLGVKEETVKSRELFAKYFFGGSSYTDVIAGLLLSPTASTGQFEVDSEVTRRLLLYGALRPLGQATEVPDVLGTLNTRMKAVAGVARSVHQDAALHAMFCQQIPLTPLAEMLGGDKSSVLRASIDFITYKRLKGKVTIIDEIVESCCVVLDVLSFHHSSIRDEMVSRNVFSQLIVLGMDMDFPYARHALNAVFRASGVGAVQQLIKTHLVKILRAGLDKRDVQTIVDDDVFMEGMVALAKVPELASFIAAKDNDVILRYMLRVLETGQKKLYEVAIHFLSAMISRLPVELRPRFFGQGAGASMTNVLSAASWLTPIGESQLKVIKASLNTSLVPTIPEQWYRAAPPVAGTIRIKKPLQLCSLPSCVPSSVPSTEDEIPSIVKCERCSIVYYCNASHQRLHHDLHSIVCAVGPDFEFARDPAQVDEDLAEQCNQVDSVEANPGGDAYAEAAPKPSVICLEVDASEVL